MLRCPKCQGGMKIKKHIAICKHCGKRIFNKEDEPDAEKKRKKRSVKTMTRDKL